MFSGKDQRKFPRIALKASVTLTQETSQGEPMACEIQDISLGGLGVLLESGLDIFAPVQVEIDLEDGMRPLVASGVIVWVVRSKKGKSFDTGIEFVDLKGDAHDRIQALLNRTDSGTSSG